MTRFRLCIVKKGLNSMEKLCRIVEEYLYLPICVGKNERKIEIFLRKEGSDQEKVFEFLVPVDGDAAEEYDCDYYAEIPVRRYLGGELLICGDMPQAFADRIMVASKRQGMSQDRPAIHFTADTGWTNDPNGLIYADGIYHLYFQYNPFNVSWNNMSWGHAVSRDLLHWKQEDTVMFPDESGTMFSGCAIANDRGLLELPKDALLFFYTAAGGSNEWSKGVDFTQKIAYSLDGGSTLTKMGKPCLPTVYQENRDPKVYWHEDSQAYVMALWLKDNDFGIFRSQDLQHWTQSDQFTLEGAWECPDLFRLPCEGGGECWFFWAADGLYYSGEFDGYHFRPHGGAGQAYVNRIPYAAQTYSGMAGRVVSIPWLRIDNDGRFFTGSYGIPVELGCKKTEEGYILVQKPVRELTEQRRRIDDGLAAGGDSAVVCSPGDGKALLVEMRTKDNCRDSHTWVANGSALSYDPGTGQFTVDGEKYQVGCGYQEFTFIIDDRILEVFFDGGIRLGTFLLRERKVRLETGGRFLAECVSYEI